MKVVLMIAPVLILALILPGIASAGVITFEGVEGVVPNGYGGLSWSNWYGLNATTYDGNPSGYEAGRVSGDYVAYNGYAEPAEFYALTPFTFTSAYLTAAWNDGLSVDITGYLGGSLVQSITVHPVATGPTLYTFGWNVDRVRMESYGGVNHGYESEGEHFAMDDLTINGVPEPASVMLLGAGLIALAGLARRRAA